MFDPELVTTILALSVVALALTQALKKWIKLENKWALLLSAVVTILVVLWKVLEVQPFDFSRFIILVIGVFLQSNGMYQFGSYAIGKMAKEGKG